MAVNSTMVPLGTTAPAFELADPAGRRWSLGEVAAGRPVVVAFMCNHCPYVRHIGPMFGRVADELGEVGVGVVAINSNDTDAYPDDAPERMTTTAAEWGWRFPYLVDADQSVATAYRAACTPDLFVFDASGTLAYRGQFDSSRPGREAPVTGEDLLAACRAVLAGQKPPADQRASMGCNIKWRPGNEPPWFA